MATPERVRNWLGIAFLISLVLHAFALPLLSKFRSMEPQDQQVEKVSVTKKIRVIVPTPPPPTPPPTPRPTLPPTPPPKDTPPPVATTPPKQKRLKVNVPKTVSKDAAGTTTTERTVVVKPGDSVSGVPQGTETAGPAEPVAGPATAGPACSRPYMDAVATNKVEPDYPEMARQQGAVGTATIRVSLAPSGAVSGAAVYKSSGNAQLDTSALRAARSSSYRAEIRDCQPVAGDYLFVATFEAQ
jgi:protein TonB